MRHFLLGGRDVSPAYRGALWVGLLCVYSGAGWLFALIRAAGSGWLPGSAALLICLGGALAVGVGLCAGERWAWAGATCLAVVYATGAFLLTGWLAWGLATHPEALSWQPVVAGLPREAALRGAIIAGASAAAAILALRVLWRAQSEFDIPYRRTF